MDFSYSEEQQAVRALASQIFSDHATHERLLELARSGEWVDMALWRLLADANQASAADSISATSYNFGITDYSRGEARVVKTSLPPAPPHLFRSSGGHFSF